MTDTLSLRYCLAAMLVVMAVAFALFLPGFVHAAPVTIEVQKGTLLRLDRDASSVMIANPEIADLEVKSPRLIYLYGKTVGETAVYALDKDDKEILHAEVAVTHNLRHLREMVKRLVPGSTARFGTAGSSIVMEGTVASPKEADDVRRLALAFVGGDEKSLVNMLNVSGSDQVMLRVRIAEVARSELNRFGIHLESLLNPGNFAFGIATGRSFLDASGGLLRSPTDDSIFLHSRRGSADINGVIDALQGDGLVTVLAEPTLSAVSGKTASFLAGGEFPVPAVDQDGVVTVEFHRFGVSLSFTPVVMSKERISLTVAPEVSTLSQEGAVTANGFSIPSLATRRAETSVELASGQSFAIAGLLQNNTSNDIDKFPALGDLPILGALFRSTEFRRNETELAIIVTPYVVRGTSPGELTTPVDGFEAASDVERILFGKLYKEKPAGGAKLPRLHGNAGFVVP